jgi:hypothetical protein
MQEGVRLSTAAERFREVNRAKANSVRGAPSILQQKTAVQIPRRSLSVSPATRAVPPSPELDVGVLWQEADDLFRQAHEMQRTKRLDGARCVSALLLCSARTDCGCATEH